MIHAIDRLEGLPLLRPPIEAETLPKDQGRRPRPAAVALQGATVERHGLPDYYHAPLLQRLLERRAEFAMIAAALALSVAIGFVVANAVG